MDRSISLRSFFRRKDAFRLGDVVYMPEVQTRADFVGTLPLLMERLEHLPHHLAAQIKNTPSLAISFLCGEVRDLVAGGQPLPAWTHLLPPAYRAAVSSAWAENTLTFPQILLGFPATGIGGYALEIAPESMLGRAYDLFQLKRLGGIRQLAWLTTPVLPQEQPEVIPTRFEHNRLTHVCDVAAVANLLAHGLGLSKTHAITLVLAAFTHDARTPAGGDTTKLLDRTAFDEDVQYPSLLEGESMAAFLGDIGVPAALLCKTILGQGTLGALLDIADKTAYVSRDAHVFHWRFRSGFLDCEEGEAIHELLLRHPRDICGAWRSVELRDEKPVFTDPEALSRFLLLRALLFRALYWHPGARFTEFVVSHLILRHLVDEGKISFPELLTWTDRELDVALVPFKGIGLMDQFGEPQYEGFEDAASALRRKQELLAAGERCVMIETLPPRVKSGTQFLVTDEQGMPRPLATAHPDLAQQIDSVATVVHPHRLYYIPFETMPQRLRDIIP